jgi:hypothetical protein
MGFADIEKAIADFGRTLKNDSTLPANSKDERIGVNNRVMAYYIGVMSRRTDDDLARQIPAALAGFNKKTSAEKGEFITKCTTVLVEQVNRTFRPLISGSSPK